MQDQAQHAAAHPHSYQCMLNRAGTRGVRPAQRTLLQTPVQLDTQPDQQLMASKDLMSKPH